MLQDSLIAVPQQASSLTTWLLTGTSISALVGGAWAFYRYVDERQQDRQQRIDELKQQRTELRWRQAQAAKQLLDEMQEDSQAVAAMDMLDSESRIFEIAPDTRVDITVARWLAALQPAPDSANVLLDSFVRGCFDSLFYFMAMLDHYVAREFVLFEDAKFPLDYYIKIMAEDKAVYRSYLSSYGLTGTERFLERFPDWVNAR